MVHFPYYLTERLEQVFDASQENTEGEESVQNGKVETFAIKLEVFVLTLHSVRIIV